MSVNNISTNEVNVVSDTFEWAFKKFSLNNCEQQLLSPIFGIEIPNKVFKWQIKWYPQGFKNKDHSALYLVSLNKFDVEAEFTLFFIDFRNKKLLRKLSTKNIFHENTDFGYNEFLKISSLKKLKNFSIFCNITVNTKLMKIIKENAQSERMTKDLRLQELNSLEKLIENDEFSDVSLTVGGQHFAAHKCLLANKSPVFAAMLRHEMKEKESSTIIIEDIKPAVFKEVLRFIYAGKIDKIENMHMDLFMAADKYSLEGLKDLCVMSLCDAVSVDNAVEYLEFSDLYHLDKLEKKVSDFIVEHSKEFIDSPELKQMGIRKPELFFKVFRELALVTETFKNK